MVAVKAPKTNRCSQFMSTRCPLIAMTVCLFLLSTTVLKTMPSGPRTRGMGLAVHAHSAKHMVHKPHLVYGTAWKKDETAHLVFEAVKTGFRFIDTACQPKHYNEAGVGNGWTAAAQELGLAREDLWLQTKFTPVSGQDPKNVPYDPKLPLADQAKTSLEVSLKNLHTDYLDSWVLHSPLPAFEETMTIWRVMEEAVDEGKVRQIGISNCYDTNVFRTLYQEARHKPSVSEPRLQERRMYWNSSLWILKSELNFCF